MVQAELRNVPFVPYQIAPSGTFLFALAQQSSRRDAIFKLASLEDERMESHSLDPDMTVDQIMRRWPATIRLFIQRRMLCIGCQIGIFHTVSDACEAHGIDEAYFSRDLLAAVTTAEQLGSDPVTGQAPTPRGSPISACGSRPPEEVRADPSR